MKRILIVAISVCLLPDLCESKTYNVSHDPSNASVYPSVTQALRAAEKAGDTSIKITILEGGSYEEDFPWTFGTPAGDTTANQTSPAPVNVLIEAASGLAPILLGQNSPSGSSPFFGSSPVNLSLVGSNPTHKMVLRSSRDSSIIRFGSKTASTGSVKMESVSMEGFADSSASLLEIVSPCSAGIKDSSFCVNGMGPCLQITHGVESPPSFSMVVLDNTIIESTTDTGKNLSGEVNNEYCGLLIDAPVDFCIKNKSILRGFLNSAIKCNPYKSGSLTNIRMIDSSIEDVGRYGVYLDYYSNLTLAHSVISRCGLSAITRSSDGSGLENKSAHGPGGLSILKNSLIDTGAPHALEFRIPCDVQIEDATLKGYSDWGITFECAEGVGKRECVIRNTVFDQREQTERAVGILVAKGTMKDGYSFDLSDCSFLSGGAGIVIQSASQSLKAERCVFDQISGSAINTLENGDKVRLTVDHCDFHKCLVGLFLNNPENNALVTFTNFVDCGFIETNGFSRGGTIFHNGVGVVTDKNNVFASRFAGGGLAPTPEGRLEMDPNSVQTDDVDQYLSVEYGNVNYMRLRPATPGTLFVDPQGELVHSGSKLPGDTISRNYVLY